ncbi:MAG: helix-turn-helix transcriptional regulator [Verrucomicrobia bacterium]|nr:helix-turn-helix transcriptional regulator [Verrucomicrobiota bacterium]
MSLPSRFRALRESRNLSQADLAEKARLSRESISSIETGKPIKVETLKLAARPLHLSENEWLSLLVDWIAQTIGSDFYKLEIRTTGGDTPATPLQLTEELVRLVSALSLDDQRNLRGLLLNQQSKALLRAVAKLPHQVVS